MILHLGTVDANSTLYIPFHTFNSSGASVTITGLATTDIEIYKNGSTTQRASDNGYALLDTDGIDFDGITGIHGISIDLSDNSDSGFYASGSFYWVVISSVTIDSQTVNFVAATFRIGTVSSNVTHYGGTAGTFSGGRPEVNTTVINGNATNANLLKLWLDSFETGTAQSGAASTITLAAGASTNILRNSAVKILSGTGAGQIRGISAYNTGTKIATIYPDWATNPDNTSVYLVIPMMGEVSIEAVQRDTSIATGLNTFGFDYGGNGFAYAQIVSTDNNVITASSISADAITEIQSGLATSASIAALNNLSAAQVNAEVVDALATDTYAEPGQGSPAATTTLAAKINYLYKAFRNRITQTSTTLSIYADDATTVDHKATVSDDGTTYSRGEIATGP